MRRSGALCFTHSDRSHISIQRWCLQIQILRIFEISGNVSLRDHVSWGNNRMVLGSFPKLKFSRPTDIRRGGRIQPSLELTDISYEAACFDQTSSFLGIENINGQTLFDFTENPEWISKIAIKISKVGSKNRASKRAVTTILAIMPVFRLLMSIWRIPWIP